MVLTWINSDPKNRTNGRPDTLSISLWLLPFVMFSSALKKGKLSPTFFGSPRYGNFDPELVMVAVANLSKTPPGTEDVSLNIGSKAFAKWSRFFFPSENEGFEHNILAIWPRLAPNGAARKPSHTTL